VNLVINGLMNASFGGQTLALSMMLLALVIVADTLARTSSVSGSSP
jgi:hypothetical protein